MRIQQLERDLKSRIQAPTVPLYDPTNPPQDAVLGQIFLGTDNSFNWYDGTSWHSQPGTASSVISQPRDAIEGQIAIGTDGSFHWYVNGQWYSSEFHASTVNRAPQDPLVGQIVIGTDGSFHWYASSPQDTRPPTS